MKNEYRRRIGALGGLALGFSLMFALGFSGLVAAFCFGAGGAVLGGMIGERSGSTDGSPAQLKVNEKSHR